MIASFPRKLLTAIAVLYCIIVTTYAADIDIMATSTSSAGPPRRNFRAFGSILVYPVGTSFATPDKDADLLAIAQRAYNKMIERSPVRFPGKSVPSCVAALAHDNFVYTGSVIMGGGAPPWSPQPPGFANTWDLASQTGLAQAITSCATELSTINPDIDQQHRNGVCAELNATNMIYRMNPMVRAAGGRFSAENAKIAVWCAWGAANPCGGDVGDGNELGCAKFMQWAGVPAVDRHTQPSANPPLPAFVNHPPSLF
jgi:hypothetical protein